MEVFFDAYDKSKLVPIRNKQRQINEFADQLVKTHGNYIYAIHSNGEHRIFNVARETQVNKVAGYQLNQGAAFVVEQLLGPDWRIATSDEVEQLKAKDIKDQEYAINKNEAARLIKNMLANRDSHEQEAVNIASNMDPKDLKNVHKKTKEIIDNAK